MDPAHPIVADEPRPAPGLRVGDYELVRELGKGGMGQVFLARDLTLGRRVAVKFLSIVGDSLLARRFVVEARATARCVHENIVVIHEVASWQGLPYMVLEYLEGETLGAKLARGPMAPARLVELLTPVARALVAAHAAGIVHRDLKPDNVLITHHGVVKVLDFGIAGLTGSAGDDEAERERAVVDEFDGGRLLGTVGYMAPEQWSGAPADARTDVFALGAIGYRALTGKHPSGGVTRAAFEAAARDHRAAYPSIAALMPGLAEPIAIVIDRCLRKQPADRFPSATELLRALEALDPRARRRSDDACPFPGLTSFTEHDADRYFGRSPEVQRGLEALRTRSVLAVVGHSGSGKSSFARAGLAAGLASSGEPWLLATLRPGRAPLRALLAALARLPGLALPDDARDRLRAAPGSLGAWLRAWCAAGGHQLAIVVDQLEELFAAEVPADERAVCVDALLAAVDDAAAPIRLIVTLRSDFLPAVAAYPALADAVVSGTVLLTPLDRGGLRAALTGPLAQAGYQLEDTALVDEVVAAFDDEPHALPVLQAVASQLWARRDPRARLVRRSALTAIGGVAGALARHATGVIRAMPTPHQRVAQAICLRLVSAQGIRQPVARTTLEAVAPSAPAVLTALLDARLVVARDDDAAIELTHEVLITGWPMLADWLRGSVVDRAGHERVAHAATAWRAHGRPAELLWAGDALALALHLARHAEVGLDPTEAEFVAASVAAGDRSRRRRRLALAAGLIVAAAISVGSVLGVAVLRRAERAASAEARRATAEATRSAAAERALAEQVEALEEAERQRAASASIAEERAGAVQRGEAALGQALAETRALLDQRDRALTREREVRTNLEAALARERDNLTRERARAQELDRRRSKIIGTLP